METIVSITTTKERLSIFFYALQSLKKQKYDNYKIFINISEEPYLFDGGISVVPEWMNGDNVQINFVKNSGPYRKLIPIIDKLNVDDIIVTADDDVLYSEDWLKNIVKIALKFPDFIICGRARYIKKNIFGRFQNYQNWPIVIGAIEGFNILPVGCSGIAYRIKLLDLDFLTDESYFKIAPTSDDMWFRISSMRKNIKVYADQKIDKSNAYIRHDFGLEQINIFKKDINNYFLKRAFIGLTIELKNYLGISLSKNDVSWKKILHYSNSIS